MKLPAPVLFKVTLEDGAHLQVKVEQTPRGSLVTAEEKIDGQVVGRIEASQLALQRALGFAQRCHQPENMGRDQQG